MTTGIPTLDYYVSYKPFEVAHAQEHYSEKLVTFSDFSNYDEVCMQGGARSTSRHLPQPTVPANVPSRDALFKIFGIAERVDEDTVVYVCHQTLFKLIPEFDKLFRCV